MNRGFEGFDFWYENGGAYTNSANRGRIQFHAPACPTCSNPESVVVPRSLLKQVVRLTHPDRHPSERNDAATKVTAAINAAIGQK